MPPEFELGPEDRRRLSHMLKSAIDARTILGQSHAQDLQDDMVRTRALVNWFTEIGEAASRVSPSLRAHVPDVPWRDIVGMRNTVVHVYWGIDLHELVKTTRDDLPPLITALRKTLGQPDD